MPRAVAGLSLLSLFLAAGCGLGGSDDAREPERRLGERDLARMVLPQEDLGETVRGLRLTREDSGPTNNYAAADDTLDPTDTAASLKADGRISGFDLVYERPGTVAHRRGAAGVATSVELFEDGVYAAQYLNERVADYDRYAGKTVDGVRLRRVDWFDVDGVGEEAHGVHVTVGGAAGRLYATIVAFRRGRLVGSVWILRTDARRQADESQELATSLDVRMRRGLEGTLGSEPPVLGGGAAGRAVPEGQLADLTLAASDVDSGAAVSDEGRKRRASYVAYYRAFEDVIVGDSHLRLLRAETQLYGTPAEAAAAHRAFGTAAGRKEFARGLVRGLSHGGRLDVSGVAVQRLAVGKRGLNGLVVTFRLEGLPYEVAAVFAHSGRLVASVAGACFEPSVQPRDLIPVAERARARLTAV